MAARRIQLSLVFYGLVAAAALAWGALRDDIDLYHHPASWLGLRFPASTGAALAAGVGVALIAIATTRALVRRTHWARNLHLEFRHLLGPVTGAEIAVFALTSGIAEEMFFRGALQPAVGILISGLVFGLVHVGPRKAFVAWTAWAAVMGWVFGVLYAATGELLAPIVAHALINYENLHFIDAFDPTPRQSTRLQTHEPPRLVGPRARD